jgi:hypothetical protein
LTATASSAYAAILYPAADYYFLLDLSEPRRSPIGGFLGNFCAAFGKMFMDFAGPAQMNCITNVLTPCFGFEHFPGDPPPNHMQHNCVQVIVVMQRAGFAYHKKNDSDPSFDCTKAASPSEILICADSNSSLRTLS